MVAKRGMVDAYSLLKVINGSIVIVMLLAYPSFHGARYVNGLTMLLGLVLAMQTHFWLSRREKPIDPFVLVLLYYVTVYYTFRIVTLAIFDTSDVFRRFAYGPEDTNYALAFIIACTACMLWGFDLKRAPARPPDEELRERESDVHSTPRLLVALLLLSVAASVSGLFDWLSDLSQLVRVVAFFARPTALLAFVGAYCVLYYREVPRKYLYVYAMLYLVFAMYLTIGGTRGAIVSLIELLAILLIANNKFSMHRRHLLKGLVLVPFLAVSLVVVYNFSTLQRGVGAEGYGAKLEATRSNVSTAIFNGDGANDARTNIGHIFSRVGFLDISAEIISHQKQYSSIFSPSYYMESIFDNVLSPGFDIFDTPKVSYALIFIHQNLNDGVPSKSFLTKNNIYHSDQLGLYGELYALFGWYSLIFLFVFAFSLKWMCLNFSVSPNRYGEVLKKVVILIFFVQCINSFGLDWIAVQMLPFALTAFLLSFSIRKASRLPVNQARD